MKASEFKLRITTGLEDLINTYFGNHTITDKFLNSTLKVIVKQKSYMLDDAMALFTDKNGEIDTDTMIDEYSKIFRDEKIVLDIRDYVNNDFIKSMLPDKALVIKIDDILNMLD